MYAPTITMSTEHRQTRYQRVMMFFVLMFLALQLLGAGLHTHAYTDHEPDCAACAVVHLPTGGVPPATVHVAPVALQSSLPVLAPSAAVRAAQTSYLTPPSHAPPGVAVTSI
ncbi:hypothetical protein [Duganella sp. CY15W]|uniref:hypothetical protein n=1 Tax=Duganella sp. CY15W TaxID=2692172 RepID=UPI001E35DB02|nr:hypothetical protein [Duganella sp. CY15W]